ncbi:MAG: DUF547 domain-containing protein [Bdellovibrionaceae bacterium]|nr:DUF547 domain-containing protein [Pseudobdellovibrionaceae bacterium]|tara:strand:- start:1296 stop:2105 length:810 start_codon:yes stop_codon:yes gene_type:complete
MLNFFSIFLLFCSFQNSTLAEEKIKKFDHQHSLFQKVLNKYIIQINPSETRVHYSGLKKEPEILNQYLEQVSLVTKENYKKWDSKQRLSFLINAYNAFTLKWIVKNYPTSSIKKTVGFFSNPWKQEFFKLFGEDSYLDQIEHQFIRKNFKEPRIHFAVNCASIGCPALSKKVYTSENLETQLEENTLLFLKDSTRNRIDKKNKIVYLSKIFDWYESDFEKYSKSVPNFVSSRISNDSAIQNAIKNRTYKIKHLDYDWNLNKIPDNGKTK